ncbi:MAG: hypothetical protein VW644_13460 [Alphaproteobacteria bacterium]
MEIGESGKLAGIMMARQEPCAQALVVATPGVADYRGAGAGDRIGAGLRIEQ